MTFTPWATPNTPNLADYTLFVTQNMEISTVYLPSNSPFLSYAFNAAINTVLNIQTTLPGVVYTVAVYNCAGHIQLMITPDQTGYTFFQDYRKNNNMLLPSFGVVQSSSDEATSVTNAVPDGLKNLTIQDLNFMLTPYGRTYLTFAQSFGPTVWGLS